MAMKSFSSIVHIGGLWRTCQTFQSGKPANQYKNGDTAAICGHSGLFEGHPEMRASPLAMEQAAASGNLQMLRILHESGAACTSSAMDKAAANGHIEVIKFLNEHRTEGASFMAMNLAAGNGHLEVLQYLHKNRKEGCTSLAYSLAAAQGRIDMLNWLKTNTQVTISVFAMDQAAAQGQVAALQWLKDNGCQCTPHAIDKAARNGHLSAVKWLTKNSDRGFTYSAVDVSASQGNKEILVHLVANGAIPEPTTLTLAAINDHIDIAAWLVTLGVTPSPELDLLCAQTGKHRLLRYLHTLAQQVRASQSSPKKLPQSQRNISNISEDSLPAEQADETPLMVSEAILAL